MLRSTIIQLILAFSLNLYGQRNSELTNYPIVNYQSTEIGQGFQNWSILEDKDGLIHVANNHGIIQFDGVKWRLIKERQEDSPSIAGLVRSMDIDQEGVIFAGRSGDFGYLRSDSIGQTSFRSLNHLVDSSYRNLQIWATHVLSDKVIFRAREALFIYSGDSSVQVITPKGTYDRPQGNYNNRFTQSFKINNRLYVYEPARGISCLVNDSLHVVTNLGPINSVFLEEEIKMLLPFGTRMLAGTRKGFFWLEGNEIIPFSTEADQYIMESSLYKGVVLSDSTFGAATVRGGFVVIDTKGRWLGSINLSSGLQSNAVLGAYLDKKSTLWLALGDGIAKVDFRHAVSIYDEANGLPPGAAVHSVAKWKDQLYLSTSLGLYSLNEGLGKQVPKFNKVNSVPNEVFNFYDLLPANNSLLVATNRGVFEVGPSSSRQISHGSANTLFVSPTDSNQVFIGDHFGVDKLSYLKDRWEWSGGNRIESVKAKITGDLVVDRDNQLWAGSLNQGILKVNLNTPEPSVEFYGSENGLPTDKNNSVALVNDNVIVRSGGKFFAFDQEYRGFQLEQSLNESEGQSNSSIVIKQGREGRTWKASGNQFGFTKIDETDTVQRRFFISESLAGSREWRIFEGGKNEVWVTKGGALMRYNTAYRFEDEPSFKTVFRSIKVNQDSLVYGGGGPLLTREFDFENNTISFEYAGLYYHDLQENQYRYHLEGFSKGWSRWEKKTEKQFEQLPEGDYRFRVQTKNLQGVISEEATFNFTIQPPWQRSTLAYILYGIVCLGLLWAVFKWRFRYLEAEKKHLANVVKERTAELEKQNMELDFALTELKQTQSQLVQSEKMGSLGQLTAGVAHEINNPVNFIKNGIEALDIEIKDVLRESDTDVALTEVDELIESIKNGANRTYEIVKGLRTFSRLDEDAMKEYDVEENIKSTLLILRSKMNDQVTVSESYCDTNVIEAFPGKLNQVFMNLLDNAVQAILDSGESGRIEISTKRSDEHLVVSIVDTGPGIVEENLSKIFDPFFTTKDVGKGTGLGLSISHSIIEEHNGRINVKSVVGEGTEFVIELPIHQN